MLRKSSSRLLSVATAAQQPGLLNAGPRQVRGRIPSHLAKSLVTLVVLLFAHDAFGIVRPDFKRQAGAYVQEGNRLRRLSLNRAAVKTDKKRKIVSLLVLGINQRKTIVIPGATAKVSIHTTRPTFYINAPDAAEWQFALIRLEPREKYRKISEVFISPIRRDVEKKSETVATRVRVLSRRLYEITPMEPLSPGEYALARLPRIDPFDTRHAAVELDVWDFRVDPIKIKR